VLAKGSKIDIRQSVSQRRFMEEIISGGARCAPHLLPGQPLLVNGTRPNSRIVARPKLLQTIPGGKDGSFPAGKLFPARRETIS
jgi:hypothetical protein